MFNKGNWEYLVWCILDTIRIIYGLVYTEGNQEYLVWCTLKEIRNIWFGVR